jgi:hypothetical protein
MSSTNDIVNTVTNEEKKKIVNRITNLKSKKKYIKLFNIIDKEYKDYTDNSNGIFINLNCLTDNTLSKIVNFLDKNDVKRKKKHNFDSVSESSISESSISLSYSETLSNSSSKLFSNTLPNTLYNVDTDTLSETDTQSLTISFVDDIEPYQTNIDNNDQIKENDIFSDSSEEIIINEIQLTNIEKKMF